MLTLEVGLRSQPGTGNELFLSGSQSKDETALCLGVVGERTPPLLEQTQQPCALC